MRMIKASYPRLKYTLQFEKYHERFIITRLTIDLFNHQTYVMGQYQIMIPYIQNNTYFGYSFVDNDFKILISNNYNKSSLMFNLQF